MPGKLISRTSTIEQGKTLVSLGVTEVGVLVVDTKRESVIQTEKDSYTSLIADGIVVPVYLADELSCMLGTSGMGGPLVMTDSLENLYICEDNPTKSWGWRCYNTGASGFEVQLEFIFPLGDTEYFRYETESQAKAAALIFLLSHRILTPEFVNNAIKRYCSQ